MPTVITDTKLLSLFIQHLILFKQNRSLMTFDLMGEDTIKVAEYESRFDQDIIDLYKNGLIDRSQELNQYRQLYFYITPKGYKILTNYINIMPSIKEIK